MDGLEWLNPGRLVRSVTGGVPVQCVPVVMGGITGPQASFLAVMPDTAQGTERLRALLDPLSGDDMLRLVAAGDESAARGALVGNGRIWLTPGGCVQLQLPEVEPVCVFNVYGDDAGPGWDWDVLSAGSANIALVGPDPGSGVNRLWLAELPAELDESTDGAAPCGRQCVTTSAGVGS